MALLTYVCLMATRRGVACISNRDVEFPPYELTETGWGEFDIVVTLHFRVGQICALDCGGCGARMVQESFSQGKG